MEDLRNEAVYFETRNEQLLAGLEEKHGISRRQLLTRGAMGIPLLAGFARLASPQAARAAAFDGGSPIIKPLPPEWFDVFPTNAEMRWDAVPGLGFTIPNARFFVRDHTATPTIDASSWRLNVFGTGLKGSPTVDNPIQFSYTDLLQMPSQTTTCFVECAGNGRSYYGSQQGTPAGGTQWHLGGIGVAEWKGVALSEVLRRVHIQNNAVDVMPYGLDNTFINAGVDAGNVRRPMPVSKALDDVILAYEMNGDPLPLDHGFPVRAIVPGWVGIANIKWIGQIEVSSTPLFSLWNTAQYRFIGPTYPANSPPLTNQAVKSAFELARGAQFPVGTPQVLTGRSWSGNTAIKQVDVSVDNGATWQPARLLNEDGGPAGGPPAPGGPPPPGGPGGPGGGPGGPPPPGGPGGPPAPGGPGGPGGGPGGPPGPGGPGGPGQGGNDDLAWTRWSFAWTPTTIGSLNIQARATDKSGVVQPTAVPFNTGGYLFWAIVEHPVVVV